MTFGLVKIMPQILKLLFVFLLYKEALNINVQVVKKWFETQNTVFLVLQTLVICAVIFD